MRTDDFDYELPADLIAQYPLSRRADSRMLCLDRHSGTVDDRLFADLPGLLRAGDLVVINDTRVIRARLLGRKQTGARCEAFVERAIAERRVLAQVRSSRSPRAGTVLLFGDVRATVLGRDAELFLLEFDQPVDRVLENQGHVPLPPYIRRPDQGDDVERYQTVYARHAGAVAAPTAGLHFDRPTLASLVDRGIGIASLTLHVGAGTFQPVRCDNPDAHPMHAEQFEVSQQVCDAVDKTRMTGGRVIAIGTTVVRSLESASMSGKLRPIKGDTDLFIRPGFKFRTVDAMLTNFHLPRSTLLMLVSAFAGRENVLAAYRHAVVQRYRFFSYGDAMLISTQGPGTRDEV